MSDIKGILDAMAALAAAIPGASTRPGSTYVSLHDCEPATLRLLVDAGGTMERYESDDGRHEWDSASFRIGAVGVYAYGKHRPTVRAEVDVDAAITQAEAAVSS